MNNEWIENMRKISIQAVEAGKPCNVVLGTVAAAAPLSIRIDQKTTLTGSQVIVPRYLTDHAEQMSIPQIGEVQVTVKNALQGGEPVILIQEQGAQRYLVVDRY